MSEKPRREKRMIVPPLRDWPPIPADIEFSGLEDGETLDQAAGENGLAGADDIVQWLALLMNDMEISYDVLARNSGVPARTIKKWFSGDSNARTSPKLRTIQACFEALGHSLIAVGHTVPVSHGKYRYPIKNFRQALLEKWLEQSAKNRGVSVETLIETLEEGHKQAISRGTKGYRRRNS